MSKKQALTEFHRGSILAAAERLFAEKGTERTTMDDIAREAEYSKATLYVYFQSKEEIINAILLNGMLLLQKKLRAAAASSPDWREAYQNLCAAIIHFYSENPMTYDVAAGDLMVSADQEAAGRGAQEILRVTQENNDLLAEVLRRGVEAGSITLAQPEEEMVQLLWGALTGIVRLADCKEDYLKEKVGVSREEFLRHGVEMLLNTISAGKSAEQ